MYKRPRPKNASVLPPANLGLERTQAAGLGWQRWVPQPIEAFEPAPEDPVVEPEEPEIEQVDLLALEAERQAQELEALRQNAHAQGLAQGLDEGRASGFERGYEEGMKEGFAAAQERAETELQAKLAVLDVLISASEQEIGKLQDEVGQALVHLGVRVAEHVLGHALKRPAPTALAMVKEVLRHNDEQDEVITIWLHPNDLKLIEEDIKALPTLVSVRLLPDDSLSRGGVRARSAHGDIDATLQSRWEAALASVGYRATHEDKE